MQEDGTIGARRIEDAPTSHPWRWLATILCAAIICFAIVASVGTFVNGGLHG
jgi:hypothetical protein